jgi:hypothetical protein
VKIVSHIIAAQISASRLPCPVPHTELLSSLLLDEVELGREVIDTLSAGTSAMPSIAAERRSATKRDVPTSSLGRAVGSDQLARKQNG